MGLFRKSGCGNASPGAAQQKAVSSRKDPPPQFVASMPSCNTACIDMHAEVSAPAHALFSLLSDPFQHEKIFSAIEGSAARLLEHDGPRKKYELDYAARWKFWKVSGVCQNLLHMETDSDKGTVSFKLREPGFLRVYEGTWTILPVGADALNLSNRGVLDALSSTPCLNNDGARRSCSSSSNSSSSSSSSYQSSSSGHASFLERNLLAAMAEPKLNSPLMGSYKAQHALMHSSGSTGASQLALHQTSPSSEQVQNARAVVRVSNMLMSPKIAPPYPLNYTLKSQVISQVQEMLDGLLAATMASLESNSESVEALLVPKP